MAYSYMTAVSDGTLKTMPITFNYMKEDDLVVHHNITKLTKGIDYTINNNIITFAKVIPALDRIAVDRMSQRDTLRVDFTEGATFSRDNIDDVLTQLLYLTQEAVEGSVDRISPTGILDLAGNRIINLGDPVDLQDAVPLHLVVDAEKSVYASEAKCKQYRDEALGYKDAAFASADRAYASELNAKKSEEIALQLLAESAEASKLVIENLPEMRELAASAEESADRAGAMVDRVEDALVAVEGYGDRLTAVENGKLSTSGGTVTGGSIVVRNSGNEALTMYDSTSRASCSLKYIDNIPCIRVGGDGAASNSGWGVYGLANRRLFLVDGNGRLFAGENRVYDTSNLTPSAIGAVSSSNVVGTLAEGALFEKYHTPDGWTVIKRIDGTMEMSRFFTQAGQTNANGYIRLPNISFPEPFSSQPCVYCNSVTRRGTDACTYSCDEVSASGINRHFARTIVSVAAMDNTFSLFVRGFHNQGRATLEEPEVEDNTSNTLEEPPILDTPQVLPYDPEI